MRPVLCSEGGVPMHRFLTAFLAISIYPSCLSSAPFCIAYSGRLTENGALAGSGVITCYSADPSNRAPLWSESFDGTITALAPDPLRSGFFAAQPDANKVHGFTFDAATGLT